jgi:YgiT-type zinc finger domain
MICIICRQAIVIDGLTSITFERGETRLVVNSVPARICPSCGEAYVDEDIASRLLHMAKELSARGLLDLHCEYSAA